MRSAPIAVLVPCHRGDAVPKSLQTTLLDIIDQDGAPAKNPRHQGAKRWLAELTKQ